MNKINSYVGFAIKSRKYVAGQTPLKHCKEKLYLILVCKTATDNLKNLAKNLAYKHQCDVIELEIELKELTHLEDIKIIGLTDENLSKAIICEKEK